MKARNPETGEMCYFIDKCLPFGTSISCALFQAFSNALAHIVKTKTGKDLLNYLDDYFFAALIKLSCNAQVRTFIEICDEIRFPVSLEKTFWATTELVFLGLLINTIKQTVSIPKEKIDKALELVTKLLSKSSGKITLNQLQKICGFLNFIRCAIVPGRAFTQCLYAYTATDMKLKPHHHIRINAEMKSDLTMWQCFLRHPSIYLDFTKYFSANEVDVYSDASRNLLLGMGDICGTAWMFQQWDSEFIKTHQPSIEYLELFALVTVVINWVHHFRNRRIILFCDNMSIVHMVNNTSSSCKNCMVLIRKLVLTSLIENTRIYARYVASKENCRADLLSRMKVSTFKLRFPDTDQHPTPVPDELWPMKKLWIH